MLPINVVRGVPVVRVPDCVLFVLCMAACCPAFAADSGRKPLQTVSSVDLTRYAGKWYEIARYPNRFQRDCVGNVVATYTLRPDGKVAVLNECAQASGKIKSADATAKVKDKDTNAKLSVTFFWPFFGDYWIISLGQNYEYAVVGEPSRKYLWILSRTPTMDDDLYNIVLERIAANGYDTSKLVKTPQLQQAGR